MPKRVWIETSRFRAEPKTAETQRHEQMRLAIDRHGFYVGRLGTFGIVLAALSIGAMAAFLLAGALLLWIPILIALSTACIISALLRPSFRR